jgi:hypothetical protein
MNAKIGRPHKAPEDKRTKMVSVPLTEAERGEVDAAAEAEGVKLAAWARGVLLRAAQKKRAASGERGSRTRTVRGPHP